MQDVQLKIADKLYGGWLSISIQRSIEQLAGQFSLGVTERWSGQSTPWPIRPGDACEVQIDGESVITGYVDDVEIAYDAGSHSMSVSGRDRTGDLVDCSAPIKNSSWRNKTLLGVAEILCKPFGIAVRAETDVGKEFPVFRANPGDSVFTRLDVGAQARGVLLVTDGKGNLVITRASNERIPATLRLGENVLSCATGFSHKDRHSTYTVTGQCESGKTILRFSPDLMIAPDLHITCQEDDKLIRRHRPLIIAQSSLDNIADACRRAKWEQSVRFGRSQTLRYIVQGWQYSPGQLWPINRLVSVQDNLLGIDDDRLIAGVSFTLDDGGMRTELTLVPPEAFAILPLPEEPDKGTGDNWNRI